VWQGFARRIAPVFRYQAGGSGISNKSLTRQRRRARPAAMAGVRDAFDVGGHDFSGEIQRLKSGSQLGTGATQCFGVPIFERVARLNLVELAVPQAGVNLPDWPALARFRHPVTEMGGERIIIRLQAIGRKHGWRAWREPGPDFMHKELSIHARATPAANDEDELGVRIERHPHPDPFFDPAQFGDQFVQLQMTTHQVSEPPGVQALGMVRAARQPTLNCAFVMGKNAAGGCHIHAFAGGRHHPPYFARRRVQVVQRRVPARGHLGPARLALVILNGIHTSMVSAANQGVKLAVGHLKI